MSGPSPSTDPTRATQTGVPDQTTKYASLLATNERVLLVRQRHWLTFLEAGRWFGLALLAGVGVWFVNGFVPDDGILAFLSTLLTWAFVIFIGLGIVGIGWYIIVWYYERYLVTTRRVIEAGGVINKYSRDTSLGMITDMMVGHPWIGRIFGYGELDLLTASEAGTSKIRFLPDADGFKRVMLDAKHEYEMEIGGGKAVQMAAAAAAPLPAAPPAPASTPEEPQPMTAEEVDAAITRLADMRDRGLITPAEFEAKKAELLQRL
jgi:uncharacterized membrane protein YdbT with pleckstrin-like domain